LYLLARPVYPLVGRTSFVIAKDHNPAKASASGAVEKMCRHALTIFRALHLLSSANVLSLCQKTGMRGGAVIPSCFRVSAHLGHGLWACPLGQVRWHSSEYKSILNSDSSIASSGSQNCPLFRACSLARASVLLHCDVNSQRAAPEANSQKFVHHGRLPMPESTIGCGETSRENPFPT
jgi:hypothetical protein